LAKLLIAEDDVKLAQTLQEFLAGEKFQVEVAADGADALQLLRLFSYDAVILDWELPSASGIEILQEYRAAGGQAPVLMLTGKGLIEHKKTGFAAGADDYLAKPFDLEELVMRIRALLRRPSDYRSDVLKLGELAVETKTCKVSWKGKLISLRPREYILLEFLSKHPDVYFTVDTLRDQLWSSEEDISGDGVRVWIHRLRNKMPAEPGCPVITNVPGVGYKLELPQVPED